MALINLMHAHQAWGVVLLDIIKFEYHTLLRTVQTTTEMTILPPSPGWLVQWFPMRDKTFITNTQQAGYGDGHDLQ